MTVVPCVLQLSPVAKPKAKPKAKPSKRAGPPKTTKTAAAKPAAVKTGAGKARKGALIERSDNVDEASDFDGSEVGAGGEAGSKDYDKIFQKKTQLEHILLRPDTYVGSVEPMEQEMWVFDRATDRLEKRGITFVRSAAAAAAAGMGAIADTAFLLPPDSRIVQDL